MITRHTSLLVRDELLGFAKSKVMIVLWVVIPVVATLGFFYLSPVDGMPVTRFIGLLLSSIVGTLAAVMVSVDIVNERSRKVYELFVIRPIRPETILWAKFISVFFCVGVACGLSIALGLIVDTVRGTEITREMLSDTVSSMTSVAGVIAVSAAVGVFFGVISNSILVAVILIIYIGQNLTLIPLLGTLGVLRDYEWIAHVITLLVTVAIMYFAGVLFRRKEY